MSINTISSNVKYDGAGDGPIGPVGPNGNNAPTTTLSIGSVSTLLAGQNPTATITGTAPNKILNLNLVRGDTGTSFTPTPPKFGSILSTTPLTLTPSYVVGNSINFNFVVDEVILITAQSSFESSLTPSSVENAYCVLSLLRVADSSVVYTTGEISNDVVADKTGMITNNGVFKCLVSGEYTLQAKYRDYGASTGFFLSKSLLQYSIIN